MKKYFAEFIGTFVLTFTACGAASFTGGYSGLLGVVGISLIFGMVLTALCYSIGNISGCHVNPAVTLCKFAIGDMKLVDMFGYIIAQIFGGIAAGFAMFGFTKTFNTTILAQYQAYGYDLTSLGTNGYGEAGGFLQINMWGAVAVEVILTFIFVLTVIWVNAKEEYKKVAGLVSGVALTTVHLFGVAFTGTSVNPARSFGPAFVKAIFGDAKALSQVWVFIVAPLIGALLAGLVYMALTTQKKDKAVQACVDGKADETDEKVKEDVSETQKTEAEEESSEVEDESQEATEKSQESESAE